MLVCLCVCVFVFGPHCFGHIVNVPVFGQEINGIAAALAEALFHKGTLSVFTLHLNYQSIGLSNVSVLMSN